MDEATFVRALAQIGPILFAAGMAIRELRSLGEQMKEIQREMSRAEARGIENRERIKALERRVFGHERPHAPTPDDY